MPYKDYSKQKESARAAYRRSRARVLALSATKYAARKEQGICCADGCGESAAVRTYVHCMKHGEYYANHIQPGPTRAPIQDAHHEEL